MTEAIIVALISSGFAALGYMVKLILGLRRENSRDHSTVVSRLDQLITGHEHLDGRITEVREDVRDMRTDLRAVNQRLDNHIHGN
jgi:hypothetical protein